MKHTISISSQEYEKLSLTHPTDISPHGEDACAAMTRSRTEGVQPFRHSLFISCLEMSGEELLHGRELLHQDGECWLLAGGFVFLLVWENTLRLGLSTGIFGR